MVWDGMMGGQKMDLVVMQGNLNARPYINGIFPSHIILFLLNKGPDVPFQHDNAGPHTTFIARQFLAQIIDALLWLAVS